MLGCLLISNCKANTHCVAERWISNSGLRDRQFVWISVSLSLTMSVSLYISWYHLAARPAIDWQRTGCCVTHGRLLCCWGTDARSSTISTSAALRIQSRSSLCSSNAGASTDQSMGGDHHRATPPLVSLCISASGLWIYLMSSAAQCVECWPRFSRRNFIFSSIVGNKNCIWEKSLERMILNFWEAFDESWKRKSTRSC